MKIKLEFPPSSFQDWLDCFAQMKMQRVTIQYLDVLCEGEFINERAMIPAFVEQLVDTLNALINMSCKNFSRQLNDCLEAGEIEYIPVICRRFKRETDLFLFFKRLKFLPAKTVAELEESITAQTRLYWEQVMMLFYRRADEQEPANEELLYELKRIRFLP